MAAKAMAAVAQLYAIYVFTRIHAPNGATLIFIILGYRICVQISLYGICQIIALHYVLMIIFPEMLHPFKEERRVGQILENAHSYTS